MSVTPPSLDAHTRVPALAPGPLSRGTGGRFEALTELVGPAASVLDIGCRDRALERVLAPGTAYTGVDLGPPADVVASAEEPLPFEDDTFEAVVFADVLEHLDHPHFALSEGIRVATGAVVIALPNLFILHHRIGFLRGRLSTDKYDFGAEDPGDRHRWLMNVTQAQAFAHGCAARHGWRVTREFAYDGAPQRPHTRAAVKLLSRVSGPDLWANNYMARLEPGLAG